MNNLTLFRTHFSFLAVLIAFCAGVIMGMIGASYRRRPYQETVSKAELEATTRAADEVAWKNLWSIGFTPGMSDNCPQAPKEATPTAPAP